MMGLLAVAWAGPVLLERGGVEEVVWARPFRLEEPTLYRYTREARAIDRGWLVELKVDPRYQQPHPIHIPVLWIDGQIAVRANWRSRCAVVWVPGPADARDGRVFYGSTALPETLGPEDAEREAKKAVEAGVGPVVRRTLVDEPLVLTDLTALMAAAQERVERCGG